LISALNASGFSVQLEHVSAEESRESHGFVTISNSEGDRLAQDPNFQHNRNYHSRTERTETLCAEVKKTLEAKMADEEARSPARALKELKVASAAAAV